VWAARGVSSASSFVKEKNVKRTYQPSKIRRVRTHGFRARMATSGGQKVLAARRRKGRYRIAVTSTN